MVFNHLIGVRFPVGPPKNKMFKIGIVEKIDQAGLKLLDNNPNFEYKIIEEVSKKILLKNCQNLME